GERAGIRVRAAVRDEQERRAPVALDLELGLEAQPLLDDDPRHRRDECDVARALALRAASALVDAPHRLRIKPDPGGEAEPPPVHGPEPDRTRPACGKRARDPAPRRDVVARQTER